MAAFAALGAYQACISKIVNLSTIAMVVRTLEYGIPGILQVLSDDLAAVLKEAEVLVQYRDGELIQSRGDRTRGLRIVRNARISLLLLTSSFASV